MSKTREIWGQIGATFYVTPEETETLLTLNSKKEQLFANLIKERRYKVDDQFYSPDDKSALGENDIFINLNAATQQDSVPVLSMPADCFQKIWCRMGVVFCLDDNQLQCLRQQDGAAADLVFDLTHNGQYYVEGSCLFEDGIEEDGYVSPASPLYIDLPPSKPEWSNPMLKPEGPVMSM